MTVLLTETFEAGSDGAAITTGNTAFTGIAGTPVFSNAQAMVGSLSALIDSTAALETLIYNSGVLRNVTVVRTYLRFPILPGAAQYLGAASSTAGGSAIRAQYRINADGTLRLRNGITAVGSDTAALSVDTWYRLEWIIDGGSSTQTLNVYLGHSATLVTSATGTFTNATFETINLGLVQSGTWIYLLDDVAISDTTTSPGPSVVLVDAPAAVATGTGAALDTSVFVVLGAVTAAGTGDALFDPTGSVTDLELVAENPVAGTGTAFDPSAALVANAGVATATGVASDATVSTIGGTAAIPATGTGDALAPESILVQVYAGVATGSCEAFDLSFVQQLRVYSGPFRYETWPIAPGETLSVKVKVNQTLYRQGGLWRVGENLTYLDLDGADRVYAGGYQLELSDAQLDELVDAGLSAYVLTI